MGCQSWLVRGVFFERERAVRLNTFGFSEGLPEVITFFNETRRHSSAKKRFEEQFKVKYLVEVGVRC